MSQLTICDYDPRNLSQEMPAAIGLVTSCSAQTALTTHMNAPLRGHVLRSVAELKFDDLDDLDELDRLLADGTSCTLRRCPSQVFPASRFCAMNSTKTFTFGEGCRLGGHRICSEPVSRRWGSRTERRVPASSWRRTVNVGV
jgi:hypothetical protein